MNLAKWSQISEIISGIAVLATLGFLLLEVRENTAVTRAEAYGQSVDRLNYWRMELADNPELSDIYRTFRDGDVSELSETQKQQFGFFYSALWGIYESAYYSQGYDILGEAEWDRFQSQICGQYNNSIRQQNWDEVASRLSNEFVMDVVDECGT